MKLETGNETMQLRPRPLPLIFLLVIILIFYFLNYRVSHDQNAVFVLAALGGIGIILAFIFLKASITINGNELVYKNIFLTRHISLPATTKTYIRFHHRGKSSSYYWHFETADQRKEKFSIRFYSRNSLRILAETIIEKCVSADIDPKIRDMAEGHFPWRIF